MSNLVGVTGGMGAGKSAALEELHALGAQTLDSDAIVHELYACPPPELRDSLCRRWGPRMLNPDGSVNRRALAEEAFVSEEAIAWLNARIHPEVRQRLLDAGVAGSHYVFCAVPLLFEVGWETDMACTVAVWCSRRTQQSRLAQRGWTADEVRRRQAFQLSMDDKLLRADFGIINNGDRTLLRAQVQHLLTRL